MARFKVDIIVHHGTPLGCALLSGSEPMHQILIPCLIFVSEFLATESDSLNEVMRPHQEIRTLSLRPLFFNYNIDKILEEGRKKITHTL